MSSTELTCNQHGLIVTLSQHIVVGIVRNGEDMWGHFRLSLSLVTTDNVVIVDRKPFVGVDGDTEETRVSVDQKANITLGQVVDDGGLNLISFNSPK